MTVTASDERAPGLEWLLRALGAVDAEPSACVTARVFPTTATARYVLAPADAGGAGRVVSSFNGLRPWRRRLERRAAAVAIAATRSRSMATVPFPASLVAELSRILGRDDIVIGVGIPTAGPNRKPVLQVHDRRGVPLAFAKVAWNDGTAERVRNEAAALALAVGAPGLAVPGVIELATWRDRPMLVIEPLPLGARRHRRPPAWEVVMAIAALGDTGSAIVDVEPLRPRGADAVSAAAGRMLDVLASNHGDVALPVGGCHGDLVPWNLATSHRRLYAFDWEHWRPRWLVGSDLVHHRIHDHCLLGGQPLAEAVRLARSETDAALARSGVTGHRDRLVLVALHVAHLAERAVAAVADGAPATGAIWSGLPAALDALRDDLERG